MENKEKDSLDESLGFIKKMGALYNRGGRLNSFVLALVIETRRDEIFGLLKMVKNFKTVYRFMRSDNRLPEFIKYKSFVQYLRKHPNKDEV